MCLCATVPVIPTRTAIAVLQHPHERMHPFGTARFVRLGLPNARVHTVLGGFDKSLRCEIELPEDAVLLYPHRAAEDLAALGKDDRPSTLVVLDGTWAHSRQLYRMNPWLQRLRHVRITPSAPSRYRIRREPEPDYLSTLEAIVVALQVLEPEAGAARLLAAFDGMIDRQIGHQSIAGQQARRKRPRLRPSRRTAPELFDPDLVCIYAESSRPGGNTSADRELVQLVAARADGAPLDLVLRPRLALPAANHLRHMGLTADLVAGGAPLAEARARFLAFAGGGPIAAWTPSSLRWAAPLLPAAAATAVLKTSYCNLRQHSAGVLDDVLEREGLCPTPLACHGRAARRLAGALAMAAWLRAQTGGERCS
jgi:DTW domain-containing protein YfiP